MTSRISKSSGLCHYRMFRIGTASGNSRGAPDRSAHCRLLKCRRLLPIPTSPSHYLVTYITRQANGSIPVLAPSSTIFRRQLRMLHHIIPPPPTLPLYAETLSGPGALVDIDLPWPRKVVTGCNIAWPQAGDILCRTMLYRTTRRLSMTFCKGPLNIL